MIDPDKLPAAAVEAASPIPDDATKHRIAAFLDALLADDEAMELLYGRAAQPALNESAADAGRAALTAAVQEDR
jgi:hypothetical protein